MSGTRIPDNAIDSKGRPASFGVSEAGRPVKPGVPDSSGSLKTQAGKPASAPFRAETTGHSIPRGQTVLAGDFFKQTAASLGFPKDPLSITLLAFARFFSLPLNHSLIGNLRREVLESQKTSSPMTPQEKAVMEAEALARVLSTDKGVILSPEALEQYSRFLVPPVFQEGEKGRDNSMPFSREKEDDTPDREELPDPEKVEAIARENTDNDRLLRYLNTIPGKNGQHWVVFPFNIMIRGTELSVFIRILKRDQLFPGERGSVRSPLLSGEGEHVIADVASPKRQWRFFLGKTKGKLRADIRVFPAVHRKTLALIEKEAGKFLGERTFGNFRGFKEIVVQNGGEIPSWADDLCSESLLSVNEEV